MNKYKRKLLSQLVIMIGLTIVSTVVTTALFISDSHVLTASFMSGLSGSFACIAILLIINYIRLLRNPEKMRQKQIKDMDERNILIEQNVQAMGFRIFVGLIALITIVLAFVDTEAMYLMSGVLWLAVIVKWLLYIYYKRKL